MALFKQCPVLLKEKKIRTIITENSCNYWKALEIYLKYKQTQKLNDEHHNYIEESTQESIDNSRDESPQDSLETSYRNVLVTEALIHNEREVTQMEIEDRQQKNTEKKQIVQNKQRKRVVQEVNTTIRHPRQQGKSSEESCNSRLQTANLEKEMISGSEESKKRSRMYSIYKRIREVYLSNGNWFAKVKQLANFL